MRSKTLALLLGDLGVTKSHSRPYVPDDNAYSEAQFKTLKYHSSFPKRFGCIEDARQFCRGFFEWYNFEHYHSGIGLLTPSHVHFGEAETIREKRKKVMEKAFARNPERFVKGLSKIPCCPKEVWLNQPDILEATEKSSQQ